MKRCHVSCRLCAVVCVIMCSAGLALADNWPQWRGPTNDGICKETGVPTEWSDTKNVAWKLAMPGSAGSTPVVWNDRIFLTSAEGNDTVLLCVSTEGKQLWKSKVCSGGRKFREEANEASASPSTDGEHVWVFTGTGEFACFDFAGKEVWRFNAQEKYGKFSIQHGMHVTPLLEGDRLYLSLLHAGGMWVLAFDKATGKEVWKVERPTDGRGEGQHSYASPCLWRNGRDSYLVVHGCDYATAHRLSDGKELWRLGDLNPKSNYNATLRFVTSPVATSDMVLIPTAKGGPVVAVKPDATGTIASGSAGELWRMPRGTPDVPSPVIHDGLVYLAGERGILTCLDAKTGKQHYQERLHSALYRASPVLADGKLYVAARDGTVSIMKTGPKFELVATNKLPDTLAASPVIANGRLYLRGFESLYAIGDKAK